MFNLKNADGNRIDFNEISLESLGSHLIFADVDEQSMKDAVTFILKANQIFPKQELTLFVNSVGGEVADGFALIDIMDLSRLPIRTVSSGRIMSMGVLIASAGHKGKRVMTRNCEVMAHQFWGTIEGKFHELLAQTKALQYTQHMFMQHFLRHSEMSEAQIKDILFGPTDRWLTPQECKEFGLIDEIVDELPPIAPQTAVAVPVLGTQSKSRSRAQSSGTATRKKR
jgi:ATP-dependent Clp protease protease subunit